MCTDHFCRVFSTFPRYPHAHTVPKYPGPVGSTTLMSDAAAADPTVTEAPSNISAAEDEMIHILTQGGISIYLCASSSRHSFSTRRQGACTTCRRTRLPPWRCSRHQMGFSRKGHLKTCLHRPIILPCQLHVPQQQKCDPVRKGVKE